MFQKRLNFFKIITFCILIYGSSLNAQNIVVRGIVTSGQDAINLGTATIFLAADSTLVKGTYLDSNKFALKFPGKLQNRYFVRLSIPSYSDTIIHFIADDTVINLGLISPIKNQELDGVEVIYVKEMFVRTLDGLSVNVEGTSLQTLTNLFEVLKASPKITSPDDESIEIIGRGRPLILVDRQAIISNDELRAIPANQIEKIEIITNPSAKYKAQGSGNGVIEVYTKNFHLEGYNFTISGAAGLSTQLRPAANLNLGFSLKKRKFSLSGYLGANYRNSNSLGSSSGETNDSSSRTMASVYTTDMYNTWQYYNIKGAYNVSENQKISLGINGYGSNGGNTSVSNISYFQQGALLSEALESSENSWTWLNNSAFINYVVDTDTNKSNLEINVNYTNKISGSDNASKSEFSNIITGGLSQFSIRNDTRDVPNIGELRVTYEHIFDTTGWKFSTGLSYSILVNGKRLDRFQNVNNDWIKNESQSNSYDYSENIGAAFVELTKKWKNISTRVGLRAEYTNLNGFSNTLNKTFIDSVYVRAFPSASVMWQVSDKISTTLFFDSGIDRPQFDNFDPFIIQNDSLSIQYGNPNLRPSIKKTIGLDVDLFYKYNLSLTYSTTNDPFSEISFISDNSFIQETTPWNAKDKQSLSLSFSIPLNAKWLSGWNSVWSSYDQYAFTPIFGRPTFNILTYGFYSNVTFKLPHSFDLTNRIHLSKWGRSDISIAPNVNWGARATKKFKSNKYQLYLDVDNIVPPTYQQQNISGNFLATSIGQNRFTTFKIGFFMKVGRLKQAGNIEESKSGQSGRI